jgi:hypothetical protein
LQLSESKIEMAKHFGDLDVIAETKKKYELQVLRLAL